MTPRQQAEHVLSFGISYRADDTAVVRCPRCKTEVVVSQTSESGFTYSGLGIRLLLTEFLTQHLEKEHT